MSAYDETPPEDPYAEGTTQVVDEQLFAEQSVVGAMMLSTRAAEEVAGILRGRDFNTPRHGIIFDAINALRTAGHPTDVIAVTDELIRAGDLQRAGGADYLHTLTSVVPTASNAGYYAEIVAQHSARRTLTEIGTRLQTALADPGVAIARALDDLRELRDGSRNSIHERAKSLREVLDVDPSIDAYDWAIPGLLERRDRLVLTGAEGGGKSTFLRQIAVLSAAGIHPFRFAPIEPVRVLVVDAENSEKQWRRAVREMSDNAAAIGRRDPRDAIALRCLTKQIDITRPHDLGDIHRLIDDEKPDIVLIGPLYKLVPRSINNDDDAAPVIAALDSLRDRNVALLMEAHAGHTVSRRGERDLRPRGSSALLGWPEFGLGISPDNDLTNGRRTFTVSRWRGDRDQRAWPEKLHRCDKTNPGQIWPWAPTHSL